MYRTLHELWIFITTVMLTWHQGKLFIEYIVRIPHETIHVIAGVLVWLGFAWLLRRPVSEWKPWLWLFAVILCNETVDLWMEQWPDPGQQYGEGAKDLFVTMIVPTIIMIAARLKPALFLNR